MTIAPDRLAELDALTLAFGGHESWEKGACVMEAVAYVAGEPFSAYPECASPVIGAFLRSWNDDLDDETRQRLKPYIPRLVGTKGTKRQEEKRAWMATDWLARECAPAFLRLAGLTEHAEKLEGLSALTTAKRAEKAQPTLDAARAAARAAWAASAAARAAWAAWDTAWAAWDTAWDAAWAAAWAAAATDAARDAARAAADEALAPTVAMLQESAFDLLDRMIAVTKKP
jgi:hypothetical protein